MISGGDISRQVHCPLNMSNPADKSMPAYAHSTQSSRQVHCPPMRCPHYSLANVYAIQPASALPAYSLPALLAGKYICDPAGKYIARLRVPRITRWQMYLRSSRQAPCPPTLCWPYLANLRRTLNIVKPATPLPAYALPAALDRWIVNAHYALNDNL